MAQVSRVVTIAFVVLTAAAAAGQGAGDSMDEPFPIRLRIGESVALCSTGTVLCPAADTRCDDLSVVSVGGDERGPVLSGAKPGTTLCSTGSSSGQGPRRVYRVTVVKSAR